MCDALKELMRPEFEEELAAELKNNTDRVRCIERTDAAGV